MIIMKQNEEGMREKIMKKTVKNKIKKEFRFREKEINGKTRIVVTTRRGRVLDDAQGYGYKSEAAAYRAYTYRQKKAAEKAA